MGREQIPVNKKLIEWARKSAGLTLSEATEKFSHIAAWEEGTSFPTYPQLEKLANEFKLPVAVFFFPEPPTLPPIRESFRTLPDAEFDQIPREVRFLLRKAKAFQINLTELTQGRNPAPRLITRELAFPDDISIEGMAARVRDYLGITLADQSAWPNDETALKAWRKSLHDVGIFVFKDAFRVQGYSGFSLYDDPFPIIYVNNSSTKTRQIFTLFHELAHLLFHTSGIDTLDDRYIPRLADQQKRIEILCNQFAAQFLVPEAAFNEAIAGRDRSVRTAELLAAGFHVSREGRASGSRVAAAATFIGTRYLTLAAITWPWRSVNFIKTRSTTPSWPNISTPSQGTLASWRLCLVQKLLSQNIPHPLGAFRRASSGRAHPFNARSPPRDRGRSPG